MGATESGSSRRAGERKPRRGATQAIGQERTVICRGADGSPREEEAITKAEAIISFIIYLKVIELAKQLHLSILLSL